MFLVLFLWIRETRQVSNLGVMEPGFDLKHSDFKTTPLDAKHC